MQYLVRAFSQPAAAASSQLTLNFTTPTNPIHVKKVVDKVIVPGAAGEYGVTAGHSPIISELKPGVVQVVHVGVMSRIFFVKLSINFLCQGETEKFFVAGGFALTHPNSVTVSICQSFLHGIISYCYCLQDISVPEAYALADFDEQAIKTAHAESSRAFASAAEGSAAKATAQIEIETYSAIARALGVAL